MEKRSSAVIMVVAAIIGFLGILTGSWVAAALATWAIVREASR